MIKLSVAVLLAASGLTLLPGCYGETERPSGKKAEGALEQVWQAADVRETKELQPKVECALPEGFMPAGLFSLIAKEKNVISLTGVVPGFEDLNGCPSWFWEVPIFAVEERGQHAEREFNNRLQKHLKEAGFEEVTSPQKSYRFAFRRKRGDVDEIILFTAPREYLGKVQGVVTRIIWRATSAKKAPLPTYTDIVRVNPTLKPRSTGKHPIPPTVLDLLSSERICYARNSLSIRIPVGHTAKRDDKTLDERIVMELGRLGFERQKSLGQEEPELLHHFITSPPLTSNCEVKIYRTKTQIRLEMHSQGD